MQENSKGCGPLKTGDQWKKIFTEWKMNTKRKSREIYVSLMKTGGGSCSSKKLTDLEERLLNLTSKIHLGDDAIPDTLGGCSSSASAAEVMPSNSFNLSNALVEASSADNKLTNTFVLDSEDGDLKDTICYLPISSNDGNEDVDDPQPFVTSIGEVGKNRQETQRNTRDKSEKKNKKIAAPTPGSSRYTSNILQSACSVFAESQNTILETEQAKADGIQQLASSVDNFATAVRESTRENFKVE